MCRGNLIIVLSIRSEVEVIMFFVTRSKVITHFIIRPFYKEIRKMKIFFPGHLLFVSKDEK